MQKLASARVGKLLFIPVVLILFALLSFVALNFGKENISSVERSLNSDSNVAGVESATSNISKLIVTVEESETFEIYLDREVTASEFINMINMNNETFFYETKEFEGLGEYIFSIKGKEADDNHFWAFKVNGQDAPAGISTYTVKPGDSVEFKYEEIKF